MKVEINSGRVKKKLRLEMLFMDAQLPIHLENTWSTISSTGDISQTSLKRIELLGFMLVVS